MEKANSGRFNFRFKGVEVVNDQGEVTNDIGEVVIRDMSGPAVSALVVRVNDAMIHDAKKQASAEQPAS